MKAKVGSVTTGTLPAGQVLRVLGPSIAQISKGGVIKATQSTEEDNFVGPFPYAVTYSVDRLVADTDIDVVVDRQTAPSDSTAQVRSTQSAAGFPYVLKQGAVPSAIAPTGTIGDADVLNALVLGTALPVIYSDGIWLAFPADAVALGASAGSYWCVMSSTTEGLVYSDRLDGWPITPTSPVAAEGYDTATAYTGVTDPVDLATLVVPGGTIGASGSMITEADWSMAGTVDTKTVATNFGTEDLLSYSSGTDTTAGGSQVAKLRNRGEGAQILSVPVANGWGTLGAYSAVLPTLAVDTSGDLTLAFVGTMSADADFVILEGASVEIRK